MDDLISRNKVIDVLKETGIIVDNDLGHLVLEEIERIPTAYDVEKVVEQIRCDCYTMGFDESQTEMVVNDIRKGGVE